MKYLKYFKTDADYQNYYNSDDFVTPNVSYVEDTKIVYYKATNTIFATYSATVDNKLAIANTSNVKSLKVNGNNVSFGNAYYFESNGEYKVEIELINDSIINGVIYDEDWNPLSSSMFYDAKNNIGSCLTSITIPGSVTSIKASAFSWCSSLTSITIPNSVTSIEVGAFGGCSSLTSITIPDSVTSIGENAFCWCSSLTSITIPGSVTSIEGGAFAFCSSLTSITIPDSVTSIGEGAFSDCSNLNVITCRATTAPSIMSNTFEGIKSNGLLQIPAGSDYSSWMKTSSYYLGYYNWTKEEIQH